MKILILGYSDLAQRKLIPAINSADFIHSYDLASVSKKVVKAPKLDRVFKNYNEAIENTSAETVYVSLPNSLHYLYSKIALENNKNVIVDKPAINDIIELKELTKLSKEKNLFISMSSVFTFHKGWEKFKDISKPNSSKNEVLIAQFTIPTLDKNNIRLSKKLGGGAIEDMGVYASSLGYYFWNSQVNTFEVLPVNVDGLNNSFTIMLNYGPGRTMIGSFGFDQYYKNKVTFNNSENTRIEYDRVFSQTISYEAEIFSYTKEKESKITVGADDSFLNYFSYVKEKASDDISRLNKEFNEVNLEYLKVFNNVK